MGQNWQLRLSPCPHLVATTARFVRLREHLDRRVFLNFGILSAVGGLLGALLNAFCRLNLKARTAGGSSPSPFSSNVPLIVLSPSKTLVGQGMTVSGIREFTNVSFCLSLTRALQLASPLSQRQPVPASLQFRLWSPRIGDFGELQFASNPCTFQM